MAHPLASLLLLCALVPAAALAEGTSASPLGFGYCPPPVVPGCIEEAGRHPNHPVPESCSRDVLRFTQSLGSYRACLNRESERAIGTGNAAIARFRCLAQRGDACR